VNAPVALILFNRPDLTAAVFARVAAARPPKLLLVADGPRRHEPRDVEKCALARKVVEQIDWDCEVLRNYSDVNLGCGRRPATGITWVFDQVDRAIILEDDCVPDPTFFRFCDILLERFQEDERIMQISGNNFQFGRRRGTYSYFFSRYNICAGAWATWRRAWRHFDFTLSLWPTLRGTPWLQDILDIPVAAAHWARVFQTAHEEHDTADYWDYQWTFAFWAQSGLAVAPNCNLVSNLGYRYDATHSKDGTSRGANLPTRAMVFPLEHPPYVVADGDADRFFTTLSAVPKQPSLYHRVRNTVASMIPEPLRPVAKSVLNLMRGR